MSIDFADGEHFGAGRGFSRAVQDRLHAADRDGISPDSCVTFQAIDRIDDAQRLLFWICTLAKREILNWSSDAPLLEGGLIKVHIDAMAHTFDTHLGLEDSSLVDAARAVLTGDGEQWTDMRASVFEILARAGQPVSAYAVAEQLSAVMGRRIAPNSVYRILDLFVARNLALRIESQNAFLANDHPGCIHDCIFLICDTCGATTHMDDDRTARTVRKAANRNGFQATRPIIEVRGKCEACIAS